MRYMTHILLKYQYFPNRIFYFFLSEIKILLYEFLEYKP